MDAPAAAGVVRVTLTFELLPTASPERSANAVVRSIAAAAIETSRSEHLGGVHVSDAETGPARRPAEALVAAVVDRGRAAIKAAVSAARRLPSNFDSVSRN